MNEFICGNTTLKVPYKVFLIEDVNLHYSDYLGFGHLAYSVFFKYNNKMYEGTLMYSLLDKEIVSYWLENQEENKEGIEVFNSFMEMEEWVIEESIRQKLS